MEKFTATFNKKCYIQGFGRKFYKKGVELINITDEKGNVVTKMQKFALLSFFKNNDISQGQKISFYAENQNGKISNIKSIQII